MKTVTAPDTSPTIRAVFVPSWVIWRLTGIECHCNRLQRFYGRQDPGGAVVIGGDRAGAVGGDIDRGYSLIWPRRVCSSFPPARPQTRAVMARPAVTARVPSGVTATAATTSA